MLQVHLYKGKMIIVKPHSPVFPLLCDMGLMVFMSACVKVIAMVTVLPGNPIVVRSVAVEDGAAEGVVTGVVVVVGGVGAGENVGRRTEVRLSKSSSQDLD